MIPRRPQEVIDIYEASSACPKSTSEGFILDFKDNDWDQVWMAPELKGREDDLLALSRVEQKYMMSTILHYLTSLLPQAVWYYKNQLGLVLLIHVGCRGARFRTFYKWTDTLFPYGRYNMMACVYNTPGRRYLMLTSIVYTHLQLHIPDPSVIQKAARKGQKIPEATVKIK
jgi:hypothetical protein